MAKLNFMSTEEPGLISEALRKFGPDATNLEEIDQVIKKIVQGVVSSEQEQKRAMMTAEDVRSAIEADMNKRTISGLAREVKQELSASEFENPDPTKIWFSIDEGTTIDNLVDDKGNIKQEKFTIGTKVGALFEMLFFGKAQKTDVGRDFGTWESKVYDAKASSFIVGAATVYHALYNDPKVTTAVDEAIRRAVSVIRLVTKMGNLLMVRTEQETGASENAKWLKFRFTEAMLYAKFDYAGLLQSYMENSDKFFLSEIVDKTTRPFVLTNKEDMQNLPATYSPHFPGARSGEDYIYGKVTIRVSLRFKSTGANSLSIQELYKDKADFLGTESSKIAFFRAMVAIQNEMHLWETSGVRDWHKALGR